MKLTNNNGGNNSFYNLPAWVKNADDLNEYLQATGPISNITKSLFSMLGDRHKGTSQIRDAKKILHYAIRNILWIRRPSEPALTDVDIIIQLFKEFSTKKQKYFKEKIKSI